MGFAVARAAELSGGCGHADFRPALFSVARVTTIRVRSAAENEQRSLTAVFEAIPRCIPWPCRSDYRPAQSSCRRLRRPGSIQPCADPTEDILLALGRSKADQSLVGFAAETEDLVERGAGKNGAQKPTLIVRQRRSMACSVRLCDVHILRPTVSRWWSDSSKQNIAERFEVHSKSSSPGKSARVVIDHDAAINPHRSYHRKAKFWGSPRLPEFDCRTKEDFIVWTSPRDEDRIIGCFRGMSGARLRSVDTPGIHKPRYRMNERMLRIVEIFCGVDLILLVDSARLPSAPERSLPDMSEVPQRELFS